MADDSVDPFPKLASVYRVSGSKFNQSSCKVAGTKLNAEQTGESKVISIPWCSPNSISNAWGNPNVIQNLTKRGNSGSGLVNNSNNLQEKSNSPNTLNGSENGVLNNSNLPPQSVKSPTPEKGLYSSDEEIFDSESDIVFDSDDDLSLDDTDSDTGEKSHEGRMKSKWFRRFFDILNKLKVEEINSQTIRWHCPACQGGTGAIDWYQGLQPLVNHSRTIKVRRVRLHRAFAETLEEECSRRGAPLIMAGEAHGLWEGLDKKVKDHEIVWPPMVVIMNTRYEQDENEKVQDIIWSISLYLFFKLHMQLHARVLLLNKIMYLLEESFSPLLFSVNFSHMKFHCSLTSLS
jgi:hypothetical protein